MAYIFAIHDMFVAAQVSKVTLSAGGMRPIFLMSLPTISAKKRSSVAGDQPAGLAGLPTKYGDDSCLNT